MNRHLRNAWMKLGLLGLYILFITIGLVYLVYSYSTIPLLDIGYIIIIALLLEEMTVRLLFRISRDLDKYQEDKYNEAIKSIKFAPPIEAFDIPPLSEKQREKLGREIEEDIEKFLADEDP